LHPVSANLYQGTYAGNIGLDARGQQANITVDEKLTDIQAGPLLKDLQGEDRLAGRGNLSVNVSMSGATPDDFKKTLNGVTAFAFADGAVKGINIGHLIRQALAALKGQSLPPTEGPVKTDFSELRGSVQFQNGVASNQDLQAKSPVLRVQGKGTANLVDESMDYRLMTTLVATGEGQGGRELQDLEGIPIPVRVTGTFNEPSYQVDLEALAQAALQGKAGEQKQKALEKVEKTLDKELGDKLSEEDTEAVKKLLKGLFD
jgi:AsmA protein